MARILLGGGFTLIAGGWGYFTCWALSFDSAGFRMWRSFSWHEWMVVGGLALGSLIVYSVLVDAIISTGEEE